MKNIVIFGGGFDPIHNGHMNMAKNASKALDAEVFFVPARISVWKNESGATIEDKIKMIELAIEESELKDRYHICDFEAKSDKEVNYSIDTVRYFKKLYPEDNLYLLIGTDQVNSFHKWKEAEEISKLAHIIFFHRPGFELEKENIEAYNMMEIKGELVEISSTDIKQMKSLNLPYSVLCYIMDHDLYFMEKVKSYMKEKRYKHSISVAKTATEIAIANNIKDWWRYLRAGLLHDIAKEIPIEGQISLMCQFYKEYINFPRQLYHQFLGAYLLKKDFQIKEEDEVEAVEFHTTGKAHMSRLAKAIYAADKIEPTRGFDSSDLIREMKVNIDNGFIKVLAANKEYFISKRIDYDNPLTKECMEYYLPE